MLKQKDFPNDAPVFFECGQCGGFHHRNLPGSIDCRDNAHRFTFDELDTLYGPTGWEEINLEDQMRETGSD